jgi:hypothetical protein
VSIISWEEQFTNNKYRRLRGGIKMVLWTRSIDYHRKENIMVMAIKSGEIRNK